MNIISSPAFLGGIYLNALAASGNTLVVGCAPSGFFCSTDSGTSWTPHAFAVASVDAFADTPDSSAGAGGADIFAGTSGAGVFRSTDNGTSWTVVSNGLTSTNGGLSIKALALAGQNLIAGTYAAGVFLSADSGATWDATGAAGNPVWALAVCGTELIGGIANGLSHRFGLGGFSC